MNTAVFSDRNLCLQQSFSWWDSSTDCRLVLSQPWTDPKLWLQYVDGASRSYRAYGVECALDREALATGSDTALFFVAVDKTDRILAGCRAVGPLQSPDESHAVAEWARQPGEALVRSTIAERVPQGIMEVRSAWIAGASGRGRALRHTIIRAAIHMCALLDSRFMTATAATHFLDKWLTAGGTLAPIPGTPYPDERFETKMMLWDRQTFASLAGPELLSKLYVETTHLMHAFHRRG